MLKIKLFIFLLVLLPIISVNAQSSSDGSSNTESLKYAPGELIVKLKEEVDTNSITGGVSFGSSPLEDLNRKYRIRKAENVFTEKGLSPSIRAKKTFSGPERELLRIYKFELSEDVDVKAVAEEYSKLDEVEYAEPNYLYDLDFVPNDENYTEQWSHKNVQAEKAWDVERGDSGVVIAVIDTGVDYTHEDLVNNIWINVVEDINHNGKFDNFLNIDGGDIDSVDNDNNGYVDDVIGWDFVDVSSQGQGGEDYEVEDNEPMDYVRHGTHVAGIIAAVSNNGLGISGVCHNCRIMPLRAGFATFVGGSLEGEDVAKAIKYAVDNGADIISMSFGSSYESKFIKNSIDYAHANGLLLIAAAGNSHTDGKHYPAAYKEVLSVAATDQNDARATFSNYGHWVDLAAPGVEILSTVPTAPITYKRADFQVEYLNGSTYQQRSIPVLVVVSHSDYNKNFVKDLVDIGDGSHEFFVGRNLNGTIGLQKIILGGNRGEDFFEQFYKDVSDSGLAGLVLYAVKNPSLNSDSENAITQNTFYSASTIPSFLISDRDASFLINLLKEKNVVAKANFYEEQQVRKYQSISGTSMAAPYVSGLAGLILSKYPTLGANDVKNILKSSVDIVNTNQYIGTGRINALMALGTDKNEMSAITFPSRGDEITVRGNTLDILGSASDSYTLEYVSTSEPNRWIEIYSGDPIHEGKLAAWDVSGILAGMYKLKLTVEMQNRKLEYYADEFKLNKLLPLNNFIIAVPEPSEYTHVSSGVLTRLEQIYILPGNIIRAFNEVDYSNLDNSMTLAIKDRKAVMVTGKNVDTDFSSFLSWVLKLHFSFGDIEYKEVGTSIVNDDLNELFKIPLFVVMMDPVADYTVSINIINDLKQWYDVDESNIKYIKNFDYPLHDAMTIVINNNSAVIILGVNYIRIPIRGEGSSVNLYQDLYHSMKINHLQGSTIQSSVIEDDINSAFLKCSDFDRNGLVNNDDFFLFADNFYRAGFSKFDLDGNYIVNMEDFFIFSVDFGKLITC